MKPTYEVRIHRGQLRSYTVARTHSKRAAHLWAERLRKALKEVRDTIELLKVKVVKLRPKAVHK